MMNVVNFAQSGLALLMAGSVTVGSVYVTVSASVDTPNAEPAAADVTATSTRHSQAYPSHTIVLRADGVIQGQLSQVGGSDGQLIPAEGMEVKLIREGGAVARTRTDRNGIFAASGLTPGVYAVVAGGENGYLAYAFRAVAADPNSAVSADFPPTDQDNIQINSAVVPPRDFAAVKRVISERFRRVSMARAAAAEAAIASTTVEEFLPVSAAVDQADQATTIRHRQAQLGADGSLSGLVTLIDAVTGAERPIRDLTAYFIADGRVISSASIEPGGEFNVMGLTPGLYSVVAAGNDGVMAFGADILGAGQLAERQQQGDYSLAYVSQTLEITGAPAAADNFAASGEPVPGERLDEDALVPPGADVAPFGAPPGGGFAPGGFTGGGGGFGGGGGGFGGGLGGLGTLLGAGIGGAIGYAIADDDDNPPASP